MPKLTKQFAESEAKAPARGQIIYRDEELRGFALRVTPHSKSYIVEKRVNGVNCRLTLGKYEELTVESARKQALNVLAEMANGKDPRPSCRTGENGGVTLRGVLHKYLEVKRLRPETQKMYKHSINSYLREWLDYPITSITKDMVEARHHELTVAPTRLGTPGHARANTVLKCLRTLINFAADRFGTNDEPLIKVNPVNRLTRNRAWHRILPRQGIIPDHKLSDWYRALAAVSEVVQDFCVFLLLTGMRKGESLALRWEHVDFENRLLVVPRQLTKSDREHRLPLSDFLVALLHRRFRERKNSDWVFQSSKDPRKHIGDAGHALPVIRAASGVNFQLHDCRRTFMTLAEKLDVPHYALKKLVNHHVDNDVTGRYLILDVERLRVHMARITAAFIDLLGIDVDEMTEHSSSDAMDRKPGHQLPLALLNVRAENRGKIAATAPAAERWE